MELAAPDWYGSFLAALGLFLSGQDPYRAVFFNPPWVLPILVPFAAFSPLVSRWLVFAVSLMAFVWSGFRLGRDRLSAIGFALSPLVVGSLILGNVEWLVILGLALGGPLGILLALVKPQMAILAIAFWIIQRYRAHGLRSAVVLLLPALVLVVISLILYPAWIPSLLSYQAITNVTFFPWSVPVGLFLFLVALRTGRAAYAFAASPFLFPTVTPQVWMVVLLGLLGDARSMALATGGAWAILLVALAQGA